jgi:hypothetical protein
LIIIHCLLNYSPEPLSNGLLNQCSKGCNVANCDRVPAEVLSNRKRAVFPSLLHISLSLISISMASDIIRRLRGITLRAVSPTTSPQPLRLESSWKFSAWGGKTHI